MEKSVKQRPNVPALDAILGDSFSVLDHGFIRLIDYMGTEERIVQAARVSYGAGTKTPEEDAELVRYLWRNLHTSPFEQLIVTLHCKMPIFVARQWVRHRTARLNELSGRYSQLKNEFYVPDESRIQFQGKANKQGSEGSLPPKKAREILEVFMAERTLVGHGYNSLVKQGISKEIARINLPVSTYTEWYWQIDLHNLLHFLRLRCDSHAQHEIRVYADVIRDEVVKLWTPTVWKAFDDFTLSTLNFTGPEAILLQSVMAPRKLKALLSQLQDDESGQVKANELGISLNELREIVSKLERLS